MLSGFAENTAVYNMQDRRADCTLLFQNDPTKFFLEDRKFGWVIFSLYGCVTNRKDVLILIKIKKELLIRRNTYEDQRF